MSEPALEARQDDELGLVFSERGNDDAWLSAEATADLEAMR